MAEQVSNDDLPVLPGRLQRLADELHDEGIPAFLGAADPIAPLVELAYALRPKVHENRVPTYGAILPASPDIADRLDDVANTSWRLVPIADLDVAFARRFADGVTTFAVRAASSISHLACFNRNMADEYDLVGVQAALGGIIVQRHPGGQVRLFGPQGVVRWNGISWQHDPPVDSIVQRLATTTSAVLDGVRPLLRFAIHKLSGRRIGATLIWRSDGKLAPAHLLEPWVRSVPGLHVGDVGEESAIAQALAQTDGAAFFDENSMMSAIGVRLSPTAAAREAIDRLGGMRHTSALRYSHDDPDAVVIVVSEAGPVTIMHRGRAVTSLDDRIG